MLYGIIAGLFIGLGLGLLYAILRELQAIHTTLSIKR